jgi:hypothetical protein
VTILAVRDSNGKAVNFTVGPYEQVATKRKSEDPVTEQLATRGGSETARGSQGIHVNLQHLVDKLIEDFPELEEYLERVGVVDYEEITKRENEICEMIIEGNGLPGADVYFVGLLSVYWRERSLQEWRVRIAKARQELLAGQSNKVLTREKRMEDESERTEKMRNQMPPQ